MLIRTLKFWKEMLAHEQMAWIFGTRSRAEQREGRCQVLMLDGARRAQGLESDDDEKDQPAERRSAKRRTCIVGVDEGKQRVE